MSLWISVLWQNTFRVASQWVVPKMVLFLGHVASVPYIYIYMFILTNHRTTFSTTSSLSCHRIMQIRNITFLETSENITLSYGGGIKWMETPFSRGCGKKMLYYKEWGFDRKMIRIFHLGFVMLGILGCRTVFLGY